MEPLTFFQESRLTIIFNTRVWIHLNKKMQYANVYVFCYFIFQIFFSFWKRAFVVKGPFKWSWLSILPFSCKSYLLSRSFGIDISWEEEIVCGWEISKCHAEKMLKNQKLHVKICRRVQDHEIKKNCYACACI